MSIARRLLLWGSRNRWLENQMRRRSFARRAVRRFMPGEDVGSALEAAQATARRGIGSILTQLGENITSASEAEAVRQHYETVFAEIDRRRAPAEISIKPTQLGLDLDPAACTDAVVTLAGLAASRGDRLWIDMEDSSYVDRTLDLYRAARAAHDNVGLCLQSYLYRTEKDLESLLPLNPWIRLVKGAYNEPADLAFPRKRDVDENYVSLGTRLIAHATNGGNPPILGTHDMRVVERLQSRARDEGLDKQACEVHMLFGIGTKNQQALAGDGYQVRVLISYGAAWFPWYMRRLAERPANVWFVARSLFG